METVTFSPPLYKQRHQMVVKLVEKCKAQKVADLGCARCTLLSRLKFCRFIEVLVGVDTDLELLKDNMYRLSPLPCDYLQPRPSPLTVRLYQGSVAVKDPRMLDCDFVSCIELIEHLDTADLVKFPEVLFGYMNPAVVVITTPNADFNPLLPGIVQFRHCDHKFEWSRSEFQAWCLNIGRKYDYSVEFTGVGEGPEGKETLGFCTQISIFRREHIRTPETEVKNSESPYNLVYEVVYPSLSDRKILHNAVLNEVIFAAECVRRQFIDSDAGRQSEWRTWGADSRECAQDRFSPEVSRIGGQLHIPLHTFFTNPRVRQLSGSLQQLQEILQASDRVKLSHSGSLVLYPAGAENSDN
ncbi:small RNA 2'-O-methyltransferase [Pristis pectinata]|uniref:small RNA 2'-O-methyltransferase n=1 Tax=Pristis pectinata TaxID=685728 RepID=UPI00223D5DE6|nr:small RNA 2'-O-methyltransferase [Pristis pectinata]XP_051874426.1 small RNA 2'-O-methyltransferase [Pristis pectinata]